jgi:hypothetical protein
MKLEGVIFLVIAAFFLLIATVYWFVSYEPAGTVLLLVLGLALAAFLAVVAAKSPRSLAGLPPAGGMVRRALRGLDRLLGFHEPAGAAAPLEGGPDLVPLSSPWPIVSAAGMVIIGLGLIFGTWLLVPGLAILLLGGIGWLTQLDRA